MVFPSFRHIVKKEVLALVATKPVLQEVYRILLTEGHTNSSAVVPCQQNTREDYKRMK